MAFHRRSSLIIDGPETEKDAAPADAVVRLLSGMQQLAFLFAAAKESRPVSIRFKPSSDLKQRFSLICGASSTGSYVLPIDLIDQSAQRSLFSPDELLADIREFISAVSSDDKKRASEILPDSRYRERALREIRAFSPSQGEGWSASLVVGDTPGVALNGRLTKNIHDWLEIGLTEQATMAVIGKLIRINFDENKLFIRLPVSGRQLECSYLAEAEVDLLESRRDLIQVTGEFVVDGEGIPLRLTAVSRIEPVNLSPLIFTRIEHGERVLRVKPPLEVVPNLDEETQQFFVASDECLDLHAIAETRGDLADEIAHHLVFAWSAYANEKEDALTPKAAELAESLRRRLDEVK